MRFYDTRIDTSEDNIPKSTDSVLLKAGTCRERERREEVKKPENRKDQHNMGVRDWLY